MSESTQTIDQSETHSGNLDRVRGKIGRAVREFVSERLATNRAEFSVSELHDYVQRIHGVAPGSPDRILRDGRQRGWYDYVLVSRPKSLYRVVSVGVKSEAQ